MFDSIYLLLAISALLVGVAIYAYRTHRRLREIQAEARVLRAASEHSPTSIVVTGPDTTIEYVNSFFTRVSGYSAEEAVGKTPRILSSGQTPPSTYQQMWKTLTKGDPWLGELINRRKNGELYWEESHIAPVRDEHGNVANYVAVKRDITREREDKEALMRSQRLFNMLTETMKDVIWILDLETNRFTYVSPSVKSMRGYTAEEVMEAPVEAAVVPEHHEYVFSTIARELADFRAGKITSNDQFFDEVMQPCKDGSKIWTEVSSYYWHNPETGHDELHGVSRNITQRRKAEERIRHMAHYDLLTDLPNRALFFELLSNALAQAKRNQTHAALLFLDLDDFKPINDNHGHDIGDLVLQKTARRLIAAVRESDAVGRIGGDEFVILLNNLASADDARLVAEKIRHQIGQPLAVAGKEFTVASSIGVALYPEHGTDKTELSKHADMAMYQAKQAGRNKVVVFGEHGLANSGDAQLS